MREKDINDVSRVYVKIKYELETITFLNIVLMQNQAL